MVKVKIFYRNFNHVITAAKLSSTVKLNRLRTGVWRFHSSMHKWGFAPSPNCGCGASEQTANHVQTACSIHRAPYGARGLTVLDYETRCFLITSLPASDSGSAAAWGNKRINPRPQSCLCLTRSGYPLNNDDRSKVMFHPIVLKSSCLKMPTSFLAHFL